MSYNFEDFIPVYPLQDDPEIQYKIGTKQEFLEVKGILNEPKPGLGNLYKHQEAFKRYMIEYDRMLNIHSVGTGKTCALVAVAEYLKHNPNFVKAYVLEKGDSTKNEFKNQIVNNCTAGEYKDEKYRDAKDDIQRRGAITRAVKKTYEIMSYGDLARQVRATGETPEDIDRHYSGCIFFVDEAHNLIESREKKNTPDITEEGEQGIEEIAKSSKDTYKTLWKLFHNVKRSKIILATATPMINNVKEIAPIMNLILPVDMQMPLNWDYNKVTLSQLEPFFRGRVSYVRGLDTGVVEEYQGQYLNRKYKMEFADEEQNVPFVAAVYDNEGNELYSPPEPKVKTSLKTYDSQNIIFPLIMSDFQSQSYINAMKTSKGGSFRIDEQQASCMVFPDGSYGGDFDKEQKLYIKAGKYIDRVGKYDYKITNTEFKKSLRNLDNIRKYSAKYSFIIEKELDVARRRANGEIVGNAFCYSELKTGSGLIVLSKIMEENGFEKFNESASVFMKDKNDNRVIRKDFEKKLRYGILTSGMENAEIDALLELFNSKENVNGDYCQIILGTESSRDGINIFNALRGYLVNALWHPSGTLQALARFIRATSHIEILNLIRNKMKQEGKDPALATARIEIFKLATIVDESDLQNIKMVGDTNLEKEKSRSVDLDLYALSDTKDISIRRMMKFLKQCAVDCSINYSRNVWKSDKDGSINCDYGKCNYVCYTSALTDKVSENKIDYSTYDILYSNEIVEQCREDIVNIISKKNSISIKELYQHKDLEFYKTMFINMAIDLIIKQKLTINNRFGFPVFINTDGNSIFTQTELPTYTSNKVIDISSVNIYKDILFGYYKNSFTDIIGHLSKDDDEIILSKIMNFTFIDDKTYNEFTTLFDKLSNKLKISILEQSIKEKSDKETTNDFIDAVLLKYQSYWFVKNEPITDIKNIRKSLEVVDKRGRNRKQKSCPTVPIGMIGEDKNTETVYFHTLSGIKDETTAFKVNTQFLNPDENIRVYKKSEGEWRDIYDYECQAYKNLIFKERQKLFEPYLKKFKHIGTILEDKKFRIIETKSINFDSLDQRTSSKGTACNSYKQKFDLVDILLESNYMPDYISSLELPYETREELEEYLLSVEKVNKTVEELSVYTDEQLLFFAKWFFAKKTSKYDICNYIQEMFIEEGRIIPF